MSDPKNRLPLSEEELAAAREALGQPGFDALLASLPPELQRIVEQAKGALSSTDPAAAFEALAEQAAKTDAPIDAKVLQDLVASTLGAAAVAEALGVAPDASEAADAVGRILDHLDALGFHALLSPILGDVRALHAELRAIPATIARHGGDPIVVERHVGSVRERALKLEAAAAALSGTELLAELAAAVHATEYLLDAVGRPSAALALTRAALLARSGERRGSQEAYVRAFDLAIEQGALDVGATAATGLQLDALQRGDLASALAITRRVTALAERAGDRRRVVLSRFDEGLLLARRGRAAEGEPIVRNALDEARALGRPELIARGSVVLGKIREGERDPAGAQAIYESVLAEAGNPALEGEVAQAAMGVLRLLETEDLLDPTRVKCLVIARAHARKVGDAETFGQTSLLLAESEEARGDRIAALKSILEGRDVMREAVGSNPEPLDRALRQLRAEWGPDVFDVLLRKLTDPTPGPGAAEA